MPRHGSPRRPNHAMTLRLLVVLRRYPDGINSAKLFRELYGVEPPKRGNVYDTSALRGLIREYRAGRILYMRNSPWQIVTVGREGYCSVYALQRKDETEDERMAA